jgi:hypothetical protein
MYGNQEKKQGIMEQHLFDNLFLYFIGYDTFFNEL